MPLYQEILLGLKILSTQLSPAGESLFALLFGEVRMMSSSLRETNSIQGGGIAESHQFFFFQVVA